MRAVFPHTAFRYSSPQGLDGDLGIRFLIEDGLDDEVIINAMGITAEKLAEVHAQIKAKLAEWARVAKLLEAKADKSNEEKEIRVMCEQSAIPNALADIAVSEPEKLDELEKQAEG